MMPWGIPRHNLPWCLRAFPGFSPWWWGDMHQGIIFCCLLGSWGHGTTVYRVRTAWAGRISITFPKLSKTQNSNFHTYFLRKRNRAMFEKNIFHFSDFFLDKIDFNLDKIEICLHRSVSVSFSRIHLFFPGRHRSIQSIGLALQGCSLAQIRGGGGAVPPEQVPGGNSSVNFVDN